MKKYLILLLVLFLFCSFLQNTSKSDSTFTEGKPITIIFAGDIMGHSPQYKAAYNSKTNKFNYSTSFQYVKKYIERADLAICNLEVPIAGKPYSGYPNFSSPDALLDGLKYAGYDLLLTANNHVLDRGKQGLERTIQQIEKRKLLHAGSYLDANQRDSIYPLIVDIRGVKIAFLNYTYGTNGINPLYPNIVNYTDSQQIITDIRKADKLGADFKILMMHWGTEYELYANEFQRKLARFFVKQGIQLIIGSHPHVVQDAETMYTNDNKIVPVYYSLGNSVSNQRQLNTDGGIMVQVEINPYTKTVNSTSYLPVYVHRGYLYGVYQYYLIPTVDFQKKTNYFPITTSDSISLTNFDKVTRSRLTNQNSFH